MITTKRYVPGMPSKVREMLAESKLSWAKAKEICSAVKKAPPGEEKAELDRQLAVSNNGASRPRRPVTLRQAKKRFTALADKHPDEIYQLSSQDLLLLILVLEGNEYNDAHKERLQQKLPALFAKR